LQVVQLAGRGLNNPGIARELLISRNTVKVHLSHAYTKLGVPNRTEPAGLVIRRSPDDRSR
jgi:DNA-binding NarL/FixJ family response regulator